MSRFSIIKFTFFYLFMNDIYQKSCFSLCNTSYKVLCMSVLINLVIHGDSKIII